MELNGKIPTAEEFANGMLGKEQYPTDTPDCMIEFARLHVKAAIQAILENVNMIGETHHMNNAPDITLDFVYVSDSNGLDYGYTVNKDSITAAYPLDNIK